MINFSCVIHISNTKLCSLNQRTHFGLKLQMFESKLLMIKATFTKVIAIPTGLGLPFFVIFVALLLLLYTHLSVSRFYLPKGNLLFALHAITPFISYAVCSPDSCILGDSQESLPFAQQATLLLPLCSCHSLYKPEKPF